METNLPKEKIALFDKILTCMRLAIKNSSLYPPGHPSFDSAIIAFKAALDQWMAGEEKLVLGVSVDNVLLNGEFVKEDNDLYKETADYLHPRGIITISFVKGIDINELSQLFAFLKYDTETLSKKGGIARNILATPHLVIKEIDYSSILSGSSSGGALDEKGVWKMLSGIESDLKGGALPASKSEFMKNFLKDSKRSAHVLNKIYKEALAGLSERSTAEEIKNIFSRINKYFGAQHSESATEARREMADIISGLDPMLMASLFQQKDTGEEAADLSGELFGGMSDDMIADFIVSLMQNKETMNGNFIKLFNKLSAKGSGSDGVTSLIADKLFDKKLANINTLSDMQLSIKDLFEEHPDNDFISQVYKMTVGALIDRNDETAGAVAAYSAIAKEYEEFLNEDNLNKERVRLLLNILWQESDPEGFRKVCAILADSLGGVLSMDRPDSILDIFDLFTGKLRPEQLSNAAISLEAKNMIDKISNPEAIKRLISFIPDADRNTLEAIARALVSVEDRSVRELLELISSDEGYAYRAKIVYILSMISAKQAPVIESVVERLLAGEAIPSALKDMYNIVKVIDPGRARTFAVQMLRHKDAEIRLQAVEGFYPETVDERGAFFGAFDKEADAGAKKKILSAMVASGRKETLGDLFDKLGKGFSKRSALKELVTLCGDFKVRESVPFLWTVITRRPFLFVKSMDKIRAEAIVSLGRIGTPEALECIRKASGDRSKMVRTMCDVVLKPSEKGGRDGA